MMTNRRKKAFTIVELLVSITIIGVLITMVTIAVLPIQIKSRDSRRKADVNLMISGLRLFYSDFKVYPNYTFYLGDNTTDTGAKNSNYSLGTDLANCSTNNSGSGNPSSFTYNPSTNSPVTNLSTLSNSANYNNYTLKDGFVSVNNFLICLEYMDRLLADPSGFTQPYDMYQYRVAYDYSEFLVVSRLENLNDSAKTYQLFTSGGNTGFNTTSLSAPYYFEGNGKNARQLDEDSDNEPVATATASSGFMFLDEEPLTQPGSNGVRNARYLYQCTVNGTGGAISRDDRSSIAPIINNNGTWAANTGTTETTCEAATGNAGSPMVPATQKYRDVSKAGN